MAIEEHAMESDAAPHRRHSRALHAGEHLIVRGQDGCVGVTLAWAQLAVQSSGVSVDRKAATRPLTQVARGDRAARREHETSSSGQLFLSAEMPLLAQRFCFQHALSQSPLSQIVCAIDTYRHCDAAIDGRCQPLVAIKLLNAQHWLLGVRWKRRKRGKRGKCGERSSGEERPPFCFHSHSLAATDRLGALAARCGGRDAWGDQPTPLQPRPLAP